MTKSLDNHFIKSVTRMGDRRAVVNHRDITSDSGLKLVGSGTRITSALYGKLVKHKLLPSLELCLSVDGSVDHPMLHALIGQQLEREGSPFQVVADELPAAWRKELIGRIPLPAAMAFKLTVAMEERPELFDHSIVLTTLTLYLCRRIGWSDEQTVDAITSALLHDIGILHIDPHLFEHSHRMTLAERRNLYAHPLISHLIVKAFHEYPPQVAEGVLQHHERLDGSGYPKGLRGDEIGSIGQLLGVAELIGSRFDSDSGCPHCAQLDPILKLNARRLNAEYALHLKPFFEASRRAKPTAPPSLEQCRNQTLKLGRLFADWRRLYAGFQPVDGEQKEQLNLIDEELQQLRGNLLQSGLVLEVEEESGGSSWLEDEPEYLAEVGLLLKEAGWQLSELYYLLYRRWPTLHFGGPLQEWLERLKQG